MLILKYISAKVVEATGVTPWDMVLYVLDEKSICSKKLPSSAWKFCKW